MNLEALLAQFFQSQGVTGLEGIFGNMAAQAIPTGTEATTGKPTVPNVPIERLVNSPMRVKGKGRRDTILTGADGLQ